MFSKDIFYVVIRRCAMYKHVEVIHVPSLTLAIMIVDSLVKQLYPYPYVITIKKDFGVSLESILKDFDYHGDRDIRDYFNGIYCFLPDSMLL